MHIITAVKTEFVLVVQRSECLTMRNLPAACLVLCATISVAHSFLCYKCEERDNYTKEQCEKNQKNIECSANIEATCFKQHIVKNDGTELEYRGCELKSSCKARKKNCEDEAKRKECEAACCITVGDTPCNSGVSVPANMIMVMMITAACSLRLVLG